MERIETESGTGLYFCSFWEAEAWCDAHLGPGDGAEITECDIHPRECSYCAGCGDKVAQGSACPFCPPGGLCPPSRWEMTAVAVDFAEVMQAHGRPLTDAVLRYAADLAGCDGSLSGTEIALLALDDPLLAVEDQDESCGGEAA